MKILTINTHSILEKDYEKKCEYFKDAIIKIQPDIIAMQEVSQSKWAKTVDNPNYIGTIPIKSDNHALKISKMLSDYGIHYFYNWLGIKYGYKIFEEGISVFSKKPIESISQLLLTKVLIFSHAFQIYSKCHKKDPFLNHKRLISSR